MPDPGSVLRAAATQAKRSVADSPGITESVSDVRARVPRKTAVPGPSCNRTSSVTRSLAVAVVASTAALGAASSERASRW